MHHIPNRTGLQSVLVCAAILIPWALPVNSAQAQNPDVKPAVSHAIALTGPGGLYAYVGDRWGVLHVNVTNRNDKPLELFSATYFDDEPTLQFGRKIWLPARSRLQTWHPIKIPAKAGPDGKTVHFHSLVMDADTPKEVLIRTDTGQMQHDGFLQITKETITGVLGSLNPDPDPDFDYTLDLITAGRVNQRLSRRTSSVTDPIFLPGEESLQSLDQLVICDSRPMHDAAGIESIRHWLYRGGRLWVMLDQTDPKLLNMLLGDEFQCEVVDEVTLTNIRLEAGNLGTNATVSNAEYDRPVKMLRTLVSDVEVAAVVNGWPAAFWKNCGEGRLLVTTLGPRGWMHLREALPTPEPRGRGGRGGTPPAPPAAMPDEFMSKYVPNDPMATIGSEFWAPRLAAPIAPAVLEPLAQEYVGYSIPSRFLIIGLLVGFSAVLAGAGVWLWRIGRLELLGAIGPALAVIVSLALIGAGRMQRQAVPATAASLQFVKAIPGTDDVVVDGQLALYSQDSGQASLGAHAGGSVIPEMKGMEGQTRRMIWTDMNQWQWMNLPTTAGSRNATMHTSGVLQERVTATAMFGPEGLTGHIETGNKDRHPADALVATVGGRIGVDIGQNGNFTARANSVFSGEQFLAAELLTDEQNRRRKAFQQLLTNPQRIDYPNQPLLFFWTEPWDLGFEFDAKSRALGATLVSVPLELQRPPPGTDVWVPFPFVDYRPITGPDGTRPSGLYDPRRREWAEKSWPSSTWLRFQIPSVLLPLQPVSARIVIKVTGPMGKLEIAALRQGKVEVLKTWKDPVGTLELPITGGDLLGLDAQGGIQLRLSGGDPDRPELTKTETADGPKTNYWRVESLAMELKAKTAE